MVAGRGIVRNYGRNNNSPATRNSYGDGSESVTTKTYDADGRLVKTASGKSGEPATESLYTYDERGRLKEITNADGKGNLTSCRYDEQGRKTEIKSFGPEVIERNKGAIVVGMSPWDAAERGIGAFEGGSVTTLFDERDLPIEVQILDREKRAVSRFMRAYDANGRIMEENQIQENPALMFEGRSAERDDKQLEAMNKGLRSMMSGKNGTGKSFTYDLKGRVTKVRDRNWASDTVTTTTYNEHGEIIEERQTIRSNLAYPHSVAYTIDEGGTLIPDRPNGVPEPPPPPPPERTVLNITEYRYEYDQNGNWTERTVVNRQESYEQSTVYRRTLTYF